MYHRVNTPPPPRPRVVLTEVRRVVVTGPLELRVALHAVEAIAVAKGVIPRSARLWHAEGIGVRISLDICVVVPGSRRTRQLPISQDRTNVAEMINFINLIR